LDLAVPLDVEMTRPGEGEVATSKRLLERVLHEYGRLIDAVVCDGLYLEAPFINFCIDHGIHVLAVIKDENRLLFQDAEALFSTMQPTEWREPGRRIRAWDTEGFTSCTGVNKPLRVLHTEETVTQRERIAGKWVEEEEVHHWWWATTIPAKQLSSRGLWRAGHSRWDVENDLFNSLVTHWSMNHCFKHHPTAILNFILTLFIAFILRQSFYHRNLKSPVRARFSLIGICAELLIGSAASGLAAPWLDGL